MGLQRATRPLGGILAVGAAMAALGLALWYGTVRPVLQQVEVMGVIVSMPERAYFDLRSEAMEGQLARALGLPDLTALESWAEHRVILFPRTGHLLVCAPEQSPLRSGFLFAGPGGLRTVMPWSQSAAYRVTLLCSIRV